MAEHERPSFSDFAPDRQPDPDRTSSADLAYREDAVICERCGKSEMYRMHAVWRCPACGFKTDCCGW